MPWPLQLVISVVSGVIVTGIVAGVRAFLARTRVPTALTRAVDRRSYVKTVLGLSESDHFASLDVLAPTLAPSQPGDLLARIQTAWGILNSRNGVRVICGSTQESLTAGTQLLSLGVEVRVGLTLESDDLSYHLFHGETEQVSVVNYRGNGRSRPVKLNGLAPSRVFRSNFEQIWHNSPPIEAILAEKVSDSQVSPGGELIQDRIRNLKTIYRLDAEATKAVQLHTAFRQQAPVIFIVGLPGAGKSVARRNLARKLRSERFQVEELSDYVFAFRDFVHGAILLDETRGAGFSAERGGAFKVDNEVYLRPALHALAARVWVNRTATKITIVEFARSDIAAALREFGEDILLRSQLIYISADQETRLRRLHARAEPPRIQIADLAISVVVSDDHRLPSSAESSLYDA